jgi:hypothetical protein
MPKHVLVLCQRKSSVKDTSVQEIVVPSISNYVQQCLGTDTTIEYLTNGVLREKYEDFEADYKFALDNSSESLDFIENHKEYYSLIILNTCPLIFMNYKQIYDLLEPNGIMTFKMFSTVFKTGNFPSEEKTNALNLLKNKGKLEEIEKLFLKVIFKGDIFTALPTVFNEVLKI